MYSRLKRKDLDRNERGTNTVCIGEYRLHSMTKIVKSQPANCQEGLVQPVEQWSQFSVSAILQNAQFGKQHL
jgi:hypothetical protein